MTDDPEDATDSDEHPLVGQVLAERYRIEGMLGEGGMGAVFRARHLSLDRPVAIKVLHQSKYEDEHVRRRFEREAIAVSKLDHPGCVQVIDYGSTAEGVKFLVMQLLEGQELRELTGVSRPVEQVVDLGAQVLDALEHAHRRDMVHRDLKPENIFIVRDDDDRPTVKLVDFGIVRMLEGSGYDPLTRAGMVLGTPTYMSPEQAAGGKVGIHTDLYSLGVVLYELLTGAPPFEADEAGILLRMHILTDPPPLPDTVPPAVAEVVERLLHKESDCRYESAREAREALVAAGEAGGAADAAALVMPALAAGGVAAGLAGEAAAAVAAPAEAGAPTAADVPPAAPTKADAPTAADVPPAAPEVATAPAPAPTAADVPPAAPEVAMAPAPAPPASAHPPASASPPPSPLPVTVAEPAVAPTPVPVQSGRTVLASSSASGSGAASSWGAAPAVAGSSHQAASGSWGSAPAAAGSFHQAAPGGASGSWGAAPAASGSFHQGPAGASGSWGGPAAAPPAERTKDDQSLLGVLLLLLPVLLVGLGVLVWLLMGRGEGEPSESEIEERANVIESAEGGEPESANDGSGGRSPGAGVSGSEPSDREGLDTQRPQTPTGMPVLGGADENAKKGKKGKKKKGKGKGKKGKGKKG